MLVAFWIFGGLLLYSYILYPILLRIGAAVVGKSHSHDDNFLPTVSLIIPAYNEASVVKEKIENSLVLDYPHETMELVVASDGSTDTTVEVARQFSERGVKVLDYTERKGKMGVLNAAVKMVESDVLVLTDANAMFEKDAVKKLVRHFADPEVGCVCGAKVIASGKSEIGGAEGAYWKYENTIKRLESRFGSCVGADGSIYAIRRGLYPFPREDKVIMDDLAVSLKVIEKGYRVVFEGGAVAREGASVRIGDEFRRKARILSGALTAVADSKVLLIPLKSPVWIQLYSHKLLRWMGAILMLGAVLTNLFLAGYIYRTFLALQLVFYALAFLGLVLQINGRRIGKLHMPFYFVLTNAAQIVGLWRFVTGREKPAWERLKREAA